jgi:predicted methyltransferase
MINIPIITNQLNEIARELAVEELRIKAISHHICPCCGGKLKPARLKTSERKFLWFTYTVQHRTTNIHECTECDNIETTENDQYHYYYDAL